MNSTQLGNIKDIEFEFDLPENLNLVPGSYELAYPVPFSGDTTWTYFGEPTPLAGFAYGDTVTMHYGQLDSFGLVGSPGALTNSNIILARFKARTNCGFSSGALPTFTTRAFDACNAPTATVAALELGLELQPIFRSMILILILTTYHLILVMEMKQQ